MWGTANKPIQSVNASITSAANCCLSGCLSLRDGTSRNKFIEKEFVPDIEAAKGDFEFGKETVQGAANDKDLMDEAFKAAGWTVRQAAAQTHTDQAHSAAHGRGRTRQGTPATDPSKVDEVRSPGLNRNFGEIDRDEFRKPYSPGRRKN